MKTTTLLGDLIREARDKRKLTQTDLAGKLGVSKTYVTRVEGGTAHVSAEQVGRVAKLLGAKPVDWILASWADKAPELVKVKAIALVKTALRWGIKG